MTDIADKLLNLRQAALQCSTSMLAGWSHGTDSQYKAAEQDAQALAAALAEVPDPEAIGGQVTALRAAREAMRRHDDADYGCESVHGAKAADECVKILDAALAKLEKR